MKNKVQELILQIEMQTYLNEVARKIVEDLKDSLPGIKDVRVVINVLVRPFEKEE